MHIDEQIEIGKINRRREMRKLWITGTLFAIVIFWAEAIAGQWIVGLIGVKINMWQAIGATIATNFIIAFYNGLRKYGSKKNKKE